MTIKRGENTGVIDLPSDPTVPTTIISSGAMEKKVIESAYIHNLNATDSVSVTITIDGSALTSLSVSPQETVFLPPFSVTENQTVVAEAQLTGDAKFYATFTLFDGEDA